MSDIAKCPHGMTSASWCSKCKQEVEEQKATQLKFLEGVRLVNVLGDKQQPSPATSSKPTEAVGALTKDSLHIALAGGPSLNQISSSSMFGKFGGQLASTVLTMNRSPFDHRISLHIPYKSSVLGLSISVDEFVRTQALYRRFGAIGDPFLVAFTRTSTWTMDCAVCKTLVKQGSPAAKIMAQKFQHGKWICESCVCVAIIAVAVGLLSISNPTIGEVATAISDAVEEQSLSELLDAATKADSPEAMVAKTKRLVKRNK